MERNTESKTVCNIKLIDMLEYYDVPQLFVAKFEDSESYLICMLEDANKIEGCIFLGVKVSEERLKDFYHKEIDLRSVFVNPEFSQPFFKVTENGCNYIAEWFSEKSPTEEELPKKDYYYEK